MKPTLIVSPGSHHSRRVTMLVHELGLDIELQNINVLPQGMGADNDQPDFLRLNPNGKVPVLRDGELVLWESHAIMWYLANQHGPSSLWPADLAERAHISKWQLWQAAHLSPAADGYLWEAMAKPMMTKQPPDKAALAALDKRLHRWAKVLDGALAGAPYLCLERFTMADMAVATALVWAQPTNIPLGDYTNLQAWMARVHERPSWQATKPPAMPPGPAS